MTLTHCVTSTHCVTLTRHDDLADLAGARTNDDAAATDGTRLLRQGMAKDIVYNRMRQFVYYFSYIEVIKNILLDRIIDKLKLHLRLPLG